MCQPDSAFAIYRALNHPYKTARSLLELGRVERQLRLGSAASRLEESLTIFQSLRNLSNVAYYLEGLAEYS
jgi:hypothetical protein